jgi:hypothetical protein
MDFFLFFLILFSIFFITDYRKISISVSVIWILLLGAILRIGLIYISMGISNFDLDSYNIIGSTALMKADIYASVAPLHHPYLPFILYFEMAATYLKGHGFDATIILKLLFSLFDVCNIYMLYLLSNKNKTIAFLYSINPVTILITSFHGQFDSIPLFFILAAIFFLKKKIKSLTYLAFSFAILIKTWPIILSFYVLKHAKAFKWMFLLILIPGFFVILYLNIFNGDLLKMVQTIVNYRGIYNIYGITLIIFKLFHIDMLKYSFTSLIFGFSLMLFVLSYRKKNIEQEILGLLLFLFTFTLTFGMQWLSWLVPFILLVRPRFYQLFFISTGFFLYATYQSWILTAHNIIISNFYLNIMDALNMLVWISIIIIAFHNFNIGANIQKIYFFIRNMRTHARSKEQDERSKRYGK